MKVIYTDEARKPRRNSCLYRLQLSDGLRTIFDPVAIGDCSYWHVASSAQGLAEEPGVRVVPLLRYPYKIFYRNTGEAIEILAIHHAAREERRNLS